MSNDEITTTEQRAESAFIRGAGALAKYLGVHEMSVRRWQKQHRIPYVKLGGAVLFRRSDVEEMLNRLTIPAVGQRKPRAKKGA